MDMTTILVIVVLVLLLGGSGHGLASEVGQHVFDDHKNHHFILDNEDATTGKQYIHHEHRAVQEC
jgi:K+-transporting ATPase c subunit